MLHQSVHGTNPAHGGALLELHTGSDTFVRPSMGSWVTYGLGTENQNLPGFVTICPTLAHGGVNNWSSAFLPAVYQGTPLGNASVPVRPGAESSTSRNADSSPRDMQRLQLDLLAATEPRAPAADRPRAGAGSPHRFVRAGVPHAVSDCPRSKTSSGETGSDAASSTASTTQSTDNFGRQCLMARRFAERGRAVRAGHAQRHSQWDQHGDLKSGHAKNAREVDQPIAGLLQRSEGARAARRHARLVGRRVRPHAGRRRAATAAITIPKASRCGSPAAA